MSKTIRYGLFGLGEVEQDDDGYVELPVVIQESGLLADAPPPEVRIHTVLPHSNLKFNKQWVAKLNRRADLPFYLGTAKIKVTSMVMITDEDLLAEGIMPLED